MFQDSVPAGSYNDPFLSSVWVKCESNGTWRLGTCIKIYLFSNLKKSAPAHPRRGRCSQNKSVMLPISNLTPVWVCKGMKIWPDTIRYVEVCLSLSLDDSLSGSSSSTCSGASASRRLTIRGLVLWESNRGNVRENGEITVAQCLVDSRWPKKWHWCMDVAKHY